MVRGYRLAVVWIVVILFGLAGCSGSPATQTGQPIGQPIGQPTGQAPTAAASSPTALPAIQPATETDSAPQASATVASLPSPTASGVAQSPTAVLPATGATPIPATPQSCQPTPADALGPFYVPGAPQRSQVGQGYVLTGVVRSADDCAPIPGAMVELWMAGPDGNYADAYRATIITGQDGAYRFESHAPPPYSGRPPHIHLRVTADGYGELVTQHYPSAGQTQAAFDLVLTKR